MLKEDRLKAQILTGKNIVVEAGAGTGKTTLLIARLCLSLLVENIAPEKLVALTFTDKAAAEIKTRLLEQLQQVIGDIKNKACDGAEGEAVFDESLVPDKERERTLWLMRAYFNTLKYGELLARAEAAKNNLDRANIGTIHAFCAEILKLFPLEAGIPPDCTIDSGQRGKLLFEDAWNDFLERELGTGAAHKDVWKKILPHIKPGVLQTFARELCRGKIEHYNYYAQKDLIAAYCQKKANEALAMSTAYLSPKKPTARAIEKALVWAADSLRCSLEFLQTGKWAPAEETLPKVPSSSTAPSSKIAVGWTPEAWEEARAVIKFALAVRPAQQDLFLTAYGLVAPFVEQVRGLYQERGLLTFDDLLVKTRNLLRGNPEVRRLLKEKFSALFIDEFQDTDPIQGEILLFLAERKDTCAPCWQEVKLESGKLFVVGDPKQSIYRFRGADITAYQLFTDLILRQGGEKCFLCENHRSLPEIIETANAVCALALREEPHFQPAYVPIFTTKQTRRRAVEWMFITAPDGKKPAVDNFRINQAEQIARWIAQHVGNMTLHNGRVLAYKDIALLSRVGTIAHFYTDALRRWHIPFNVESDIEFLRSQEVHDFVVLLRAVNNPEDKTALAGALRSPFGGFSDEEIYQASQRKELSLYAHTQNEKLKNFYAQLNKLAQLSVRTSVGSLLRFIMEETFFPEACMAAYESVRTLEHLEQLVSLVGRYPAEQAVSLETFIADVENLQAAPPKELKVPCLDEALDAVSLLTVHKAKGLEAPIVIFYDVCRPEKSAGGSDNLYSWKYDMYGVTIGSICDINTAFLEEERSKHNRCEESRILYVALTRAKEKLLLFGDNREHAERNAAAFAAAGLFPDGKKNVLRKDELEIAVSYLPYEEPETFIYQTHAPPVREETAYPIAQWKAAHELRQASYAQALRERKELPSGGKELFSPEQRAGAELGTICHRVLERLLSGSTLDLSALCLVAAQEAQAPARAAESETLLAPFVQSDLFHAIRACRVLACEMPFSVLQEDGSLENGVMDVVLETQDGGVWVLDYKTDRVQAGQEEKRLREKYAGQLGAYRQAAEQIFVGKTVRTSAVFIRTATTADL